MLEKSDNIKKKVVLFFPTKFSPINYINDFCVALSLVQKTFIALKVIFLPLKDAFLTFSADFIIDKNWPLFVLIKNYFFIFPLCLNTQLINSYLAKSPICLIVSTKTTIFFCSKSPHFDLNNFGCVYLTETHAQWTGCFCNPKREAVMV